MVQQIGQGCRGFLVEEIQSWLKDRGFNPGSIDGIFGAKTFHAVYQFQMYKNITPKSGMVDTTTYNAMFEKDFDEFEICLQLISSFEGTGFGGLVSNFDGAWMTAGIIGFTWKYGHLPNLLTQILLSGVSQVNNVVSDNLLLSQQLYEIIKLPIRDQQTHVLSRMYRDQNQKDIEPAWRSFLSRLLTTDVGKHLQKKYTMNNFWIPAKNNAIKYGMSTSTRGMGCCFDAQVNGFGLAGRKIFDMFVSFMPDSTCVDTRILLLSYCNAFAAPRWYKSVLSRRLLFRTGVGIVYQREYDLSKWGF